VFINTTRRQCHTGWAKKLSYKFLFISSPNIDGLTDSFTVRFRQKICNEDLWHNYLNTSKTCGYTTLQSFQKQRRRSTVTSDQACAYRGE